MTANWMVENLMNNPALAEALRISGIALGSIFLVMGFFGLLITLLVRVFPAGEGHLSDKRTE